MAEWMKVEIGAAGPAVRILTAVGRLSRATVAALRTAAERPSWTNRIYS